MAIDLSKVKKTLNLSSLKLVMYGEEKVGKSTFCSQMPEPLFIDIEGGTNFLNINRINKDDLGVQEWTYDNVVAVLNDVLNQEHNFKTLVVDSIDWLETIAKTKIMTDHPGAKSYFDAKIKALSYGGGTGFLEQYMKELFDLMDNIRQRKKMHIVLIAHTKKKNETDIQGSSFDKSVLKMTEKSEGICIEWADFILFAKNKAYTSTEENGTKKVTRGIDGGRVIYTSKNPAFSGGGRLALPEELPLEWSEFQAALHHAIKSISPAPVAVEVKEEFKPVHVPVEVTLNGADVRFSTTPNIITIE